MVVAERRHLNLRLSVGVKADGGPVLGSNRHTLNVALVNVNSLSRVNRVQTTLTLIYFHLSH